jgi:hypothetical protein
MLSDQHSAQDEVCPVREELLGQLYKANKDGLPLLVSAVPPHVKVLLALFCYRRSHLQAIGLTIAASCEEDDLVRLGGGVGAALFARSREAPQPSPDAPHLRNPRRITLATGTLRNFAAVGDDAPDLPSGTGFQGLGPTTAEL